MNYLRPELLDPLTERFVLGTMPRRARRRFDRLIEDHDPIRTKVYELETRLLPGLWALPPVNPSELVWQRIARDIGYGKQRSRVVRPGGWRNVSAALALAVVAATVGWWQATTKPPETVIETITLEPSVAVINDDAGNPLWVALVYENLQRADVEVSTAPEAQAANDYQLWIIGGDGVPVSMGLLPQAGQVQLNLDTPALTALNTGSTLAVSLEPQGGSPQAGPSGPVLYTAALLAR